ncbi:RNA-binding domain-containing protein, partial [Suhomyces tanzawaensis NRRL Y-17324]
DNTKYPPNIQKLFAPRPPLPYIESTDYASETRRTSTVTPISSVKDSIKAYLQQLPQIEQEHPQPAPSEQQTKLKLSQERKKQLQQSFARQVREWNDPELLQKNEKEFMKDPYRTVFLSRLDYQLTELELSKHFSKYGVIESVRVIRDRDGKSRGYAFLVYEKDHDAAACVNELARTGLKLPVGDKTPTRSILVDIERGRIIRSWKPRRLGGGLGGRHYTKPDARGSNTASAAASGRRIHIANNPQFPT